MEDDRQKLNTKRKKKIQERGITLIALIITIILLLILAGVTLNTALSDNGLFQKAKLAGETYKEAQDEEGKRLEEFEDEMTQIQTGVTIEQVKDNNPGNLEDESGIKVINSIEDLVFFADDVRNGNTYENKTVKLGANLDFELNKSYVNPNSTDYSKYGYEGSLKTALTTGEGFKTIGVNINSSDREAKSFKGTFDGNGKVIRNLKIDNTLDNNTDDLRIGLFGHNYGTIKNIGIENCNIKGKIENEKGYSVMVGGIVGVNLGTIELSYVSGYLSGGSDSSYEGSFTLVGGITGQCSEGTIRDCLTDCDLYANGLKIGAGGVCGRTTSRK